MLIAHTHAQGRTARTDGKRPIPQLPRQVEGLAHGLLARQPQCVLGHLRLDTGAHCGCGAEEAIRRGESFQCLMRALEVVVLDVQPHPALTVLEVRKHRSRQQLLPQALPEALDLAAGLRVVRTALHMPDPVTLELGFKLRAAAPGGVLTPLVGQDLPRGSITGNAARQGLQHQHASLVMRHRHAHQIARVIVQKGRHVNALVPTQQEREQVRLPQLVRLGTLEAMHAPLAAHPPRHLLRLDSFFTQHPPHRRRRGA